MIYNKLQKSILKKIDETADKNEWIDWKWQLRHSVKTVEQFEYLTGITFSNTEKEEYNRTFEKFPLSITPYYLSIIRKNNYQTDPVFLQSFGSIEELNTLKSEFKDPLSEDKDSPVEGITHRYPDRVLFHVSNICSMYCRHCTRKRKVGDVDFIPSKQQLSAGIEYIRNTPQVRDVLLSGGDPLMMSDNTLDWLLSEISSIPHVEVVRIGTRMPVVLPYRITDNLITILKKYQPLWINTHFNHPHEITSSSREALLKLADAGFPPGIDNMLILNRAELLCADISTKKPIMSILFIFESVFLLR